MTQNWLRNVASRLAVGAACWAGVAGMSAVAPAADPPLPSQAAVEVQFFAEGEPVLPAAPTQVAPGNGPAVLHCAEADSKPNSVPSILAKIPYLNRLFKNVAACEDGCCERIGVDFDFNVEATGPGVRLIVPSLDCPSEDQVVVFGPAVAPPHAWKGAAMQFRVGTGDQCQAAPTAVPCPQGQFLFAPDAVGPGMLVPFVFGPQTVCDANACPTAAHGGQSCPNCIQGVTVQATPRCTGSACVVHATRAPQVGRIARCAGTLLSAHSSATDSDALIEQLVEVTIEKAKLEVQLEATREREALRDELVQLAAKNAALEAKLEAQKEQFLLMQKAIELSTENERLKKRLAELEAPAVPRN